ncbi:ZIP family metal transporter [Pyrococcus abyssi]|uniref:GufA protein homolog, putative heavy metal ion transport protein n=1 Tax=Pyrococcus abyssi (strain GE5 / Orsay) TaxID=272844 RepID=Q9UYU8_PYRAB|nr:ZIP family metal transporter [Pyrococcus abyssi]CAB50314.1 gufA protein homolog, putative heavy metal ion transport protein [Pyrococcus abyssi GE5]CCE70853.1 TPA: zinc/iron permease [Pyrococcus abyssi GE5]
MNETLILAFKLGLFVAFMTSLGSLLALFSHRMPSWGVDFSLAFAAGVMIVASFTSLILPAIDISSSFFPVGIGIALGIFILVLLDKFIPHEHLVRGYEGPKEFKDKIKAAWLLAFAMIIHNLPEGIAIGVSLAYSKTDGIITGLAIGIQDVPEGTAVSLPLATLQKKRLMPILLGVLSGVAEMIMVVLGVIFFSFSSKLLPYGLSMAGGAMLYVTIKEMIPEIYMKGKEVNELIITFGFFLGFYLMLFLDTALG